MKEIGKTLSPEKRRRLTAKLDRARKVLVGPNGAGLVPKLLIYAFVILVGFVYVYPLLQMVAKSFMSVDDLVNPLIVWVPSGLNTENYQKALKVLDFWGSVWTSLYVSILPSLLQMISCSLAGYGLARFAFRGKSVVVALVVVTFLIPSQVTFIPQYLMYRELGILFDLKAYLFPALFGQGLKSTIFILVFYQFFSQLPKSLEEAAMMDGAGTLRIFLRIAVPTAVPAYLLTFLLSLVWYWNDTYSASMFFGQAIKTLPMKLSAFESQFASLYPNLAGNNQQQMMNEGIQMAGTVLNILPLVVIYFFTQRWFMEGIDKSGITGE